MATVLLSGDFSEAVTTTGLEVADTRSITLRLLSTIVLANGDIHSPQRWIITLTSGAFSRYLVVPDVSTQAAAYSVVTPDGTETPFRLASTDGPTANLSTILLTSQLVITPSALTALLATYTPLTTLAALTLDNLADVVAPAPTNQQRLAWNSATSKWEPLTASGGITAHSDLTGLDYASAGHTGFASSAALTTEQTARALVQTNLTTEIARATAAEALLQPTSTIAETIDDRVAALLIAGTNITLTYNDAAGTLTIAQSALTWVALPLTADWANYGTGRSAEYAIDGTKVWLRGWIWRSSGATTTFAQMPVGATPNAIAYMINPTAITTSITTGGVLGMWSGVVTPVILDGSFYWLT